MVDVRIGLKISLCVLAIGALFGVVEWRATVANDAVRARVDQLRRHSVQELVRAVNMLVTLKEDQLTARDVLDTSRARRAAGDGAPEAERPIGVAAAIERALVTFELQLDASRHATEVALAAVEEAGSVPAAARERRELSSWLDRLRVEIAVHHALVDHLLGLARSDPEAATRYLDAEVYPHYVNGLQPLIQGYQQAAERELREALAVVSASLTDADRDTTVLTVLVLTLALVLGLLTTRTIAQPITALRDAADRLGAGDLTVRVPLRSSGDLGAIAADFNGMAEQLQTATISKTYVDDILRSMDDILVVADLRGRVRRINRAGVEQLGWSERELIGRNVSTVIRDDAGGTGAAEMVSRSGVPLPLVCTQATLHDRAGRRHGQMLGGARRRAPAPGRGGAPPDAGPEGRTAARGTPSREEQPAGDLELAAPPGSGLDVAADGAVVPGEREPDPFDGADSRAALSLGRSHAHRLPRLRRGADAERAGLGRGADRPIRVALDVDPVTLDLDIATSCGLILNELLSNALKYAFPEGRDGVISVTFRCSDGSATLVVADNGVGLPKVPAGQEPAPSLGLRLVTALVGQLHGSWLVEGEGGTRVTLTFHIDGTPVAAVAEG